MEAGKLRHRIGLERYQTGGQDPETGWALPAAWVEFGKAWAEVTPVSAKELIAAAATHVKYNTRIKIRYRSDIDEKDRINFRGKLYNITGIQPDPNSGLEYLTIFASNMKAEAPP